MRFTRPKHQKFAQLSGLLLITAYLSSCGGSPQKEVVTQPAPKQQPVLVDGSVQLPPSEFSSQFYAAEQQLLDFDWMSADETLATFPPEQLSPTDSQYLSYLQARILYLRGEQEEAGKRLQVLIQSPAHPAMRSKATNFYRYMLNISGRALDSARLADRSLGQGSANPDINRALVRSIWSDLQGVHAEELQLESDSTFDSQWKGWLNLSLLTADTGSEGDLRVAIARWRSENPGHPGATTLPGGLGYLLDQAAALQNVALMLPLSARLAPAAKAVRDGYLANYYAAQAAGEPGYELQVIDLDRYDSVVQAYDDAVAAGANLVIGPLSKQHVATLGSHPGRTVPIMALNRVDELLPPNNTALVQLALAPEDEAAQIAEIAFGRGARRAVVIRPAGGWGVKMEQALVDRWTNLGGKIGAVASYSSQEDYSSSMATAMNLPASEQRARDIRSMLATNIEFTARRRQDLDAVFLLSRNGPEARSLKPLLAYHYAGDLPVYSTSNIYRGVADPRDKDLNGVQLVETPWLLGGNPGLRAVLAAGGVGSDNYSRLNALGADAYLLQSRFSQLQAGPDVMIRGNTGLLSLDPQLRVQRKLQPATFDGGTLRAQ